MKKGRFSLIFKKPFVCVRARSSAASKLKRGVLFLLRCVYQVTFAQILTNLLVSEFNVKNRTRGGFMSVEKELTCNKEIIVLDSYNKTHNE